MARNRKNDIKAVNHNSSFFEEIMFFLLLAIIFASMFLQGAFFERHSIRALFAVSAICGILIAKMFIKKKLLPEEGHYWLWVFGALILITVISLFNAVSMHDAVYTLSKNSGLFLLVIVSIYLKKRINVSYWLQIGMVISGNIAALYGLEALWSNRLTSLLNFLNGGSAESKFYTRMISERLISFFQYPNTTAAFLLTAWITTLHLLLFKSRPKGKKEIINLLLAGSLFLQFLAFVLTISRGMYLIGILAVIAYLILLLQGKRKQAICLLIGNALPSLILGIFLYPGSVLREKNTILSVLLIFSVMAIAVYITIQIINRESMASSNKKEPDHKALRKANRAFFYGGITVIAIGVAVVLGLWLKPFYNIFNLKSAYDRFGFYIDAWRIFLDFPLTGVGGEGWAYIYRSYQQIFYVTSDIHSYGFQLLVEHGIGGIIIIAGIAVAFLSGIATNFKTRNEEQLIFLIASGILFLHSMIDFDFQYFTMQMIFTLLISQINVNIAFPSERIRKNSLYIMYPICIACLLLACVLPIQFGRAAQKYNQSLFLYKMDAEKAISLMESASKLDPFSPIYKAALASQLELKENAEKADLLKAEELISHVLIRGKYDTEAIAFLQESYFAQNKFEKVNEMNKKIIELQPLRPKAWEERGILINRIIQRLDQQLGEDKAEWLKVGLNIRREMEIASEGKWEQIKPTDELLRLFSIWENELAKTS